MAPVAGVGAAAVVVPSAAVVLAILNSGVTYASLTEIAKRYAVKLLGTGMITRRQLSLATADTLEIFGVALMMLSLGLNNTAVTSTDLKGFTAALTPVVNGLANDIRIAAVPGWNSVDDRSWARLNADQVALFIVHMSSGTSLFKAMTTPNRQQLIDDAGGKIESVMMTVVDLRQCAANETGYTYTDVPFDSVPSAAGSGLTVPAAGSGLTVPVAGSGLTVPAAGSGLTVPAAGSGFTVPAAGSGFPRGTVNPEPEAAGDMISYISSLFTLSVATIGIGRAVRATMDAGGLGTPIAHLTANLARMPQAYVPPVQYDLNPAASSSQLRFA
jgi:hypothetical protein